MRMHAIMHSADLGATDDRPYERRVARAIDERDLHLVIVVPVRMHESARACVHACVHGCVHASAAALACMQRQTRTVRVRVMCEQ